VITIQSTCFNIRGLHLAHMWSYVCYNSQHKQWLLSYTTSNCRTWNGDTVCLIWDMFSVFGAFAKFWEVTNNSVISVHLSVDPHGITQLPLDRFFRKILIGDFSSNMTKKFMLVQPQKKYRAHYIKLMCFHNIPLIYSRNEVADNSCWENQNTHFTPIFILKLWRLW
jgi:hypothetical protein